MAKKGVTQKLSIYVEILQNGEIMSDYSLEAKGSKSLKLSSQPNKEISVPYYPVPENEYEFLNCEKMSETNIYVNVNLRAMDIVTLSYKITLLFGYKKSDLSVETKWKTSDLHNWQG